MTHVRCVLLVVLLPILTQNAVEGTAVYDRRQVEQEFVDPRLIELAVESERLHSSNLRSLPGLKLNPREIARLAEMSERLAKEQASQSFYDQYEIDTGKKRKGAARHPPKDTYYDAEYQEYDSDEKSGRLVDSETKSTQNPNKVNIAENVESFEPQAQTPKYNDADTATTNFKAVTRVVPNSAAGSAFRFPSDGGVTNRRPNPDKYRGLEARATTSITPSEAPEHRKAENGETTSESKDPVKTAEPPKNIQEIVGDANKDQPLEGAGSRLLGVGGGFHGSGGEYDKEKHYEKDGGKKFVEAHKAEQGEKADKGFKKEEAYEKGESEKHGHEEKAAHVSEKGGDKKGHVDQAQHYGEAHEGNVGGKGISVVKKGGHKKGHKSSGFHKVHHKDEYKKDEVFYDEGHDLGEQEEHAHEEEQHKEEKGAKEKKGHLDAGYHESHGAKKGEQDEGHNYHQSKGHKGEAGQQEHHGEEEEYAKKAGHAEGHKFGHGEVGGGGFSDGGFFKKKRSVNGTTKAHR
ncbi:unnamed protein product [Bemisia tabaci]|uniref:Uncharacterized protein n=1 Tax=Bemisia tabaci TaxID=7038 RepID=A0A9P0AG93_BEMTA|nr:unnamed protein product [Bemisia tabaci]